MRILHTADWHFGITLQQYSRKQEQELFLSWLLQVLQQEKIDVLIVAGDIFHNTYPSAEVLRLYYCFLADVAKQTDVQQVVIIGGNHDSASQLEAPQHVLQTLRVHVVGGYHASHPYERYLCPIVNSSGNIDVVIVAVPFIHEYHLGVRTTNREQTELTHSTNEAFTKLYRDLADCAQEQYPNAALIATGHLTCDDTPWGLSSSIFDPRYQYVALGHIHQQQSIAGGNAWYSGSPIAYSIAESQLFHGVLLVDVRKSIETQSYHASVQSKEIPCWRKLLPLKDDLDAVLQQIQELKPDAPLPPYLYIELLVEHYQPQLQTLLQQAIEKHEISYRPCIVSVRQTQIDSSHVASMLPDTFSLSLQSPQDIFMQCYRTKYQKEPTAQTLSAFEIALTCALQEETNENP